MTLVTGDNKSLCPTGLDLTNSEFILKDNDGDDNQSFDVQEFAYNIQNGVINPNNTAINIENSSDVIIGPVTQFHGPVTIYQRPSNENDSETLSSDTGQKSETSYINPDVKLVKDGKDSKYHSIKDCPILLKSTYAKLTLVGLIISLTVLIVLFTTLLNKNIEESNVKPDDNSTKIGNHSLIYRNVWGGQPPLNFTRPLLHPTSMVIISHTATSFCSTLSECSDSVKGIQAYHVNKIKSPDIGYNFLIGGDGNIYVGRDWDTRNFHRDNSIGISFIGNYIYDYLTDEMIDATYQLLEFGVKNEKLHPNYTLVCHNQTTNTESPGANVFKVVATWDHYKSGSLYFY